MIRIDEAINAINPVAQFRYTNQDVDTIVWLNGTTPIDRQDILDKQAELQAAYDALAYARAREEAYPELKEFAEAYCEKEIGENSTKWDAYVTAYNKVRSDNSKP
jgi:hypothetical protein